MGSLQRIVIPYMLRLPFGRMYDRNLSATVRIPTSGSQLRRLQALIGITGMKMAKYRPSWKESTLIWFQLIWRPHLLSILLFQVRSWSPQSLIAPVRMNAAGRVLWLRNWSERR